MVSSEERINACSVIFQELDVIVKRVASLLPAINERVNLGARGFMITAPKNATEVYSIWHSSPNTASAQDLKIYPYYPGDEEILPVVGTYFAGPQYAAYSRPIHQIALNMGVNETLRIKATFFIHELGHALAALKNGMAMSDVPEPLESRVLEEVEMRTFDYKLALALGGPMYKSQAEEVAYKIMRHRTGQQKRMPPFEGKGVALDACFGPAPTPETREERDHMFWLFCEFMAMDRYLDPKSALVSKCDLARSYMDK